MEEGNDGEWDWQYAKVVSSKNSDTLTVAKSTEEQKSDYSVDMSVYDSYNTAKLKEKNGIYEITLTDPKDNDTPKKTIFSIEAKTFRPKEMQVKDGAMSMKITILDIRYGVLDSEVVFDENRYPDAVVVRK